MSSPRTDRWFQIAPRAPASRCVPCSTWSRRTWLVMRSAPSPRWSRLHHQAAVALSSLRLLRRPGDGDPGPPLPLRRAPVRGGGRHAFRDETSSSSAVWGIRHCDKLLGSATWCTLWIKWSESVLGSCVRTFEQYLQRAMPGCFVVTDYGRPLARLVPFDCNSPGCPAGCRVGDAGPKIGAPACLVRCAQLGQSAHRSPPCRAERGSAGDDRLPR